MERKLGLAAVETAATISWFAMDACWMLDSRLLALTLAVPTLLLGLLVFGFVGRTLPSWLVTGGMASWACMNVLWMTHDFELTPWGLAAGKGLLALGIVLCGAGLLLGGTDARGALAARFRRLRLRA